MALLGKLDWTNISSYLTKMNVNDEITKQIKTIFEQKAKGTGADKTITFADLVEILAEAKKALEPKDKKAVKPKTVPRATFQSDDEVYSALGKYLLGAQFAGTLSEKQKEDMKVLRNKDGTCTVTYDDVEYTAYKNEAGDIFFVNKQAQKTLKQTIKESKSLDVARAYHNRGRAGNEGSKYDAAKGEIDHGENHNAVAQSQTFASMLLNDNENSSVTLDGQLRDGKRVAFSGDEFINTIDSEKGGKKDGKISIDELLTYLKAVVKESESVVKEHKDKGSRIYASSVNLSTKDLVNIGELFKKYDTDHDNLLDKDELNNLIADFKKRGNTATSLAKSVTDIDEAEIVSSLVLEDEGNTDVKGYTAKTGADGNYHYYNPDGVEITPTEFKQKCPTEYERLHPKKSIKPESIPPEIQRVVNLYIIKFGKIDLTGKSPTKVCGVSYECDIEVEYNTETKKYEIVRQGVTTDIEEIRIALNETTWQSKLSEEELEQRRKAIEDKYPDYRIDLRGRKNAALDRLVHPTVEDYFETVTTTFKDGRVIEAQYSDGFISSRKNISEVKGKGLDDAIPEEEQIYEPLKFSINYSGAAAQYKEKLAVFEQSLKDNKSVLMEKLKIDSDTYNMLARTAIAIAIQETLSADGLRSKIRIVENLMPDTVEAITGGDRSLGLTSIKFNLFAKDDRIAPLLKEFGITDNSDITDDRKSAIATIIILAQHNKTVSSAEAQEGIANAQGAFVEFKGKEMKEDGTTQDSPDGSARGWSNNITRQDALAAIWNKGYTNSGIKTGSITTDSSYILNIRKYANGITFVEDETERSGALARRKEEVRLKREHEEATRTFENMDNSGQMGSVIFMPKMYKKPEEYLTKPEEINMIKTLPGIEQELKDRLVQALENGEFSFGFGLTEDELNSLKNQDVKLILKHLDALRGNIGADVTLSDGIDDKEAKTLRKNYANVVARAERAFRQEYQQNHAEQYNDTGTNPSVLRATAKYTLGEESYVNSSGHRRGFQHVSPLGVNVNTSTGRVSQQNEILATAGFNVARKSMDGGANCLTGVKQAMRNAGINVEGMEKAGTVPKYAINWFRSRPNMFTQVKSIAVGNNRARDLVYSDLKSLPAGHIVIFVPEEGDTYADQAGHICITSGNGQGYSDSTDNLEWGNYYSSFGGTGKGEHGRFFVFKLNEANWTIVNGKLVYKEPTTT